MPMTHLSERDIVKSLMPIVLDIHRAPHLTHFLQVIAPIVTVSAHYYSIIN